MRIEHHDVEVGTIERRVVVAAVPQDDVALPLRLAQDLLVIHSGIDGRALDDVRLVFLALFDGALVAVEIGQRSEALRALRRQVAVRHGMADHDRVPSHAAQFAGDAARDRTLAATGADRAHRDHRHLRQQLRARDAQQPEISPGCDRSRCQMHQCRHA